MANQLKLRERLSDIYDDLLFANGFDDAIVGVVERCGMPPVVCYNTIKCLEILVIQDGMTYDEATDYFSANVLGAYLGTNTPMWLTSLADLPDLLLEQDTDPETEITDPDGELPS